MTGDAGCRCRRVSDGSGRYVRAAWLALHDEGVRIVLVDGSVLEGWVIDVLEEQPTSAGDSGILLELWPMGGEYEYADASEIQSLTLLHDQTSADGLVQKVIDVVAVARSLADGHEEEFSLVLDEHSKLEVSLRKRTFDCLPRRRTIAQQGSSE